MVKKRLIPVVLLRNGIVVQSKGFKRYQPLGNPFTIVERLSDWAADELIYLDISKQPQYDVGRNDLKGMNHHTVLDILGEIAKKCFVPLTFGGRIRTLKDVTDRIRLGADKVAVNSYALERPEFIDECAKEFGSQCIVVSIDAVKTGTDEWRVQKDGGKTPTHRSPVSWAIETARRGAGEILLNSIDYDGTGKGYDISLIRSVTQAVDIPVIACGGAGAWEHFTDCLKLADPAAIAAANIFNFSENSVFKAKKYLYDRGLPFRKPEFGFQMENT